MARDFSGSTSDNLTVPGLAGVAINFPSVSAWVNVDAIGTGYGIVTKWGGGFLGQSFALEINSAGKMKFDVQIPGTITATGATTITTGVWHHLFGYYDGFCHVYLDGVADGSAGGSAFTAQTSNADLMIGGRADGANGFDGKIADVGVWSDFVLGGGPVEAIAALAAGVSPSRFMDEFLVVHAPLWGLDSPELEFRFGVSVAINGTVPAADHVDGVGSPWSTAG